MRLRRTQADGARSVMQAAARRIESKIFDYCRYGDKADLQGVLTAVGATERELALTGGQRGGKQICHPVQELSAAWIDATDDATPEHEIALALASIHFRNEMGKPEFLLRMNLEPVERTQRRWTWTPPGPSVVWQRRSLVDNLIAVLERRLLKKGRPSLAFHHGIRLETIARFLAGETDDGRIEELLWGLVLVNTEKAPRRYRKTGNSPPLPRAFALLKPPYLPWPWRFDGGEWRYDQFAEDDIKIEPRILPFLRAERIADACDVAAWRLLVSGAPPALGVSSRRGARNVGDEIGVRLDAARLAASLFLPVRPDDVDRLMRLVVRPPVAELQGVR